MIRTGRLFDRVVLLFWASWFTVVAVSNFCDLAKTSGGLPATWKLASGNLEAMVQATALYHFPVWLNQVLLLGVVVWEGLVAWLMVRALRATAGKANLAARLDQAFAAAAALFASFCVVDELLIAYPLEGTHLRVFIALAASFGVLRFGQGRARAE